MIIRCEEINQLLIVYIEGEIDHHTSEEIKSRVEKDYYRFNCKDILFNFKKTTFMDSSGIGMIIGRYKEVSLKGGKVMACSINSDIERIFKISGLLKIIECFEDKESAISNFKSRR